jgi:hypothetical protein
MMCKHVSQVFTNSSFNAVTGYDEGKKGCRNKRYQNPLPLYIRLLLKFEWSLVCTSLVEINYLKAADITRYREISSLKWQHMRPRIDENENSDNFKKHFWNETI